MLYPREVLSAVLLAAATSTTVAALAGVLAIRKRKRKLLRALRGPKWGRARGPIGDPGASRWIGKGT